MEIQFSLILTLYPGVWCSNCLYLCLNSDSSWHRRIFLSNRNLIHLVHVSEVGISLSNCLTSDVGASIAPQYSLVVHEQHDRKGQNQKTFHKNLLLKIQTEIP
ncbi:unnamed protein product [Hymenolepis diminuta]|uniref:Uncharacterized protein n=1 Tax=Hymenolepis diminuta TaxID=6216 RepID=A0A564Z5D5_HYMDI|nr:unnamed protein product [Hymenolepis diminuta]